MLQLYGQLLAKRVATRKQRVCYELTGSRFISALNVLAGGSSWRSLEGMVFASVNEAKRDGSA
jgi:hypothetical protein